MTYPKPVTAESVAAARERLLTAKTDPDQQVYAGNMAWHIEQHASDQEGRTKDERVANWNDDAGCAGPPSETTRSRAEMPANFDDCEGIWHADRDDVRSRGQQRRLQGSRRSGLANFGVIQSRLD